MSEDSKHCRGCSEDFYNGQNPYGIQRCWNLDSMVLIQRRRVGINEPPPWTSKPERLPSCYRKKGFVFVKPDVSR